MDTERRSYMTYCCPCWANCVAFVSDTINIFSMVKSTSVSAGCASRFYHLLKWKFSLTWSESELLDLSCNRFRRWWKFVTPLEACLLLSALAISWNVMEFLSKYSGESRTPRSNVSVHWLKILCFWSNKGPFAIEVRPSKFFNLQMRFTT